MNNIKTLIYIQSALSQDPHTGNSALTPNADWWKADCGGKIYLHYQVFDIKALLPEDSANASKWNVIRYKFATNPEPNLISCITGLGFHF